MADKIKNLYILYKIYKKKIPHTAVILSFMNPEDEFKFSKHGTKFLFGRREMDAVREKARKIYIDLIARIASTPCNVKTLREALHMPNKGNPWWYHRLSEKQVESDDTFNLILQVFTILHIAKREGIDSIVIYGSAIEVAQVLATRYKTQKLNSTPAGWRYHPLRGLLSRLKYLCKTVYIYNLLKRNVILTDIKPEVIFQGIWDQSVKINKEKELKDSYFKLLPGHFTAKGIRCGWFLWFDPYLYLNSNGKSLYAILHPGVNHPQLIFIQKFIGLVDILSALFDFRPLYRYIRFSRRENFRYLFKEEECDLWPLMSRRLLYNFCNSSIPHSFLVEIASRRAFSFYRPKLFFTFLELFLLSRAFYQGARFGNHEAIKCNMQHASWGREKTFILMDRDREFQGKPDNNAMPLPDYFFVMGDLGRDILIENGIPPEKIFLTGSARYDHIKIENKEVHKNYYPDAMKVLLVTSPTLELDFEMVQAAFLAAQNLNIKLYLRSHPIAKIENMPLYKYYRRHITSSVGLLEQELNSIDLVLFTYSTVAEEAFLKGIPILQWQATGFNGSVFRDMQIIPRVYSVESLKEAFQSFLDNPSVFKPDRQLQESVLHKCFYKADARSSYRIAEKAIEILNFQENRFAITSKRVN